MDNNMNIAVNLDEALFLRTAMETTLKKMNKYDLALIYPQADLENILKQLDIIIDVLILDKKE